MTILSEMLAQEIDPFRDVGGGGLLFREFQTPFFEKGFHHRPDLVFEELFRVSRNHEVIGESNHVDPVSRKQRFQCPFEPVQGHVAERRRDDPALGVPAWVGKRRRRSMTPDFSHCASILLSSGT